MNEAPTHIPPAIGVLATNDDDIRRYAQITQGPMKTNRLLGLVGDFRLDHEEVDVAMGIRLPASVRAEQDHLGVRGSRS